LFKDREEIEALQIGNVDFIAPSVSKFGPVGINDFEVFDLPYLFDDISELNFIVKGDIGRMLLRKLEEKNIYGLGYWFNGFKNFTANKNISKVKNFRGLKMRIQSSKVIESYMRHLKTFPQVLPFSETYTALQQGVVDGTENSLSNLYTQKMHEVQSHLLMSNHGALLYCVLMNKKKWKSLTKSQKELINSSFLSSLKYQRSIVADFESKALKEIKKTKRVQIIELSKNEKSNLTSFLKKSYDKHHKRIDKDLIITIENELSKIKN
jgi:C4-dicarboxylate-binding protein DctP